MYNQLFAYTVNFNRFKSNDRIGWFSNINDILFISLYSSIPGREMLPLFGRHSFSCVLMSVSWDLLSPCPVLVKSDVFLTSSCNSWIQIFYVNPSSIIQTHLRSISMTRKSAFRLIRIGSRGRADVGAWGLWIAAGWTTESHHFPNRAHILPALGPKLRFGPWKSRK